MNCNQILARISSKNSALELMNVATTNLYIFLNTSRNHLTLINQKIIYTQSKSQKNCCHGYKFSTKIVCHGSDEVASNEEQKVTTSNNV